MLVSGIVGTKPKRVALVGDSLSVGSFPFMRRALAREGIDARLFAKVGAPIAWMIDRVPDVVAYDPDLVLVMAGTNDLPGAAPEVVSGKLTLLDSKLVERGLITVVSTIPTQKSPALVGAELVAEYNRRILERSVGDRTVDVGGVVSPMELSPDGVHPMPSGYEKMGRTWADVVLGEGAHASGPGFLGTALTVGVLAGTLVGVSRYVRP